LAEKALDPKVITLKSGMLVEILKEGTNADAKSPKASDSCEVTYSGTFKDGKSFDSGTTSFAPNQVIKVFPFDSIITVSQILDRVGLKLCN
jgi:FKBP-type peptidyl-prolyl cis-trans isomerase